MTNFKEHEGLLFKMLEEPVPLKENDENVLVRFITHGIIGEYVMAHWLDCNQENKPIYIDDVDSDGDVTIWIDENRNEHHCLPFPMFEIIGTLVKEGSKEWALYQMMRGNKVRHKFHILPNTHYAMNEKRQIAIFTTPSSMIDGGDVICHANDWLTSRQVDTMIDERTGWQIYHEPEQLNTMPVNEFADLLDAPIGWICKTRDGDSFPLKYIEVSPTRYAYEDKSGLTVYVMANGRYKKNGIDGRDIISCEHEHPKHESQYKVGDCRIEFVKKELYNLLDKI
ncbi:MAG: hypothetical protein RBT65_19105 [Methanolobus sp.]|nr:hypothetical protein [Methanolobus sp.]